MRRTASIDGRDGNDLVPDARQMILAEHVGRNRSEAKPHADESEVRSISWTPDRESSQQAKGGAVMGK